MDDLIITGSSAEKIENFKLPMKTPFDMTDLCLINSYLGVEVIQGNFEIRLCQKLYALKVLDEFNMIECNSSKSPMECSIKLSRGGEGSKVDPTHFRKLMGCLRYLTLTRSDLVFFYSFFSHFMSKLSSDRMAYAKRILRYVKRTLGYGLLFGSEKECHLFGYCDSDYAGDLDNRKSTSELIFFYGSKPIAWNCCKRKVIALSSCEAKYIASTLTACQGIWTSRFICELLGIDYRLFDLCIDNKSAIEISRNPVHHGLTKHIDRYDFIRNCVEEKKVELRYVCTDDQLAN